MSELDQRPAPPATGVDRSLLARQLSPFYQALIAQELTLRRPAHDHRKLIRSLGSAFVDLQPHQIDAALFAFQSPLSRGALLADEVGLGKTVEAGLVIAQLWAEGRRRLAILVPASLRKQWQNELFEKFDLPSQIIEGSTADNPFRACFNKAKIPICSLHYAYHHLEELRHALPVDLVVIDEAHHFRNVWKSDNKMGRKIRAAIHDQPKLLLTATPLHNNLLELYGLVSFIDDKLLGTIFSFQARFIADDKGLQVSNLAELQERLKQVCIRTLRHQVQEYIPYTDRKGILQSFTPYDDEQALYEQVSTYLQRPELVTIARRQRALMLLVYRKILASSSFAISGTLAKLIQRLERMLQGLPPEDVAPLEDLDGLDEEMEELTEDKEGMDGERSFTPEEIEAELEELRAYHQLAKSIKQNAKGDALLVALRKRFEQNRARGWPDKAVVFTESRRTQQYLLQLLETDGYQDQVTLFSGQNTSGHAARRIASRAYERWQHDVPEQKQGKLSREASLREALIHEFKHYTKILIATEAGAEGINLQFCNTVINYDLPWNPQRIEQRIGRCHRYGQKYDVVVLNFLNEKNAADQRVYQLLDQKLQLFQGVFGASDEVLGTIGSGVGFEKLILGIYQSCRTPAEINAAFDELQEELSDQIQDRLAQTRRQIMERFDDEVRAKLRLRQQETQQALSWAEERMLALLISYLGPERIRIDTRARRVEILSFPPELRLRLPQGMRPGFYCYGAGPRAETEPERIQLNHPIFRAILAQIESRAVAQVLPVELLYTEGGHKITRLEPYLGCEGFWLCFKLTFKGLEQEEQLAHLIFVRSGIEWQPLEAELCQRFSQLTARPASWLPPYRSFPEIPANLQEQLEYILQERIDVLKEGIQQHNYQYIDSELDKLDRYREDSIMGLEAELDRSKREWEEAKHRLQQAITFQERMESREQAFRLERRYRQKIDQIAERRSSLFAKQERAYKDLKAKAKLFVQHKLVAIAYWRVS
ncbi:MAG TPA: DEAD/DEAH box helicase [Candidatus Fraserbacteria bacterium]|nr:DEAD/DEAH box helicase [Candidatus Fraserbacteria bacterium]